MDKAQKRQVAHKVRVNDIVRGSYIKEEGEWSPNYVLIGDRKVSRVNLMAVIVSKESFENSNYSNLAVDDGSGRISVRSFEGNNSFDNVNIGEFIMVIGRPREYLNEKYIVSEILKKIKDSKWIEVRKLELEKIYGSYKETPAENLDESEIEEEAVIEEDANARIFKLIKEIDLGEGADMQEVITQLNSRGIGAEETITKLLESGEVFQIKSGKLKILE